MGPLAGCGMLGGMKRGRQTTVSYNNATNAGQQQASVQHKRHNKATLIDAPQNTHAHQHTHTHIHI